MPLRGGSIENEPERMVGKNDRNRFSGIFDKKFRGILASTGVLRVKHIIYEIQILISPAPVGGLLDGHFLCGYRLDFGAPDE